MDILAGGSRRRLTKYRANLARSLETIRRHRTPEEAERFISMQGYTSPLNHRATLAALLDHGVRAHGDAPIGQHLSGGAAPHWPYKLRSAIHACHNHAAIAESEFVAARKPRQREATARAMLRALSAN